jgi:hypothetical protein
MRSSERKLPFLCECGNVGCEKCVPMQSADYAKLRQPALAPEHALRKRKPADRDRHH